MTKEEFSKLNIEMQIDYFNSQMILGKSAAQVNKELGYNEATTRKKFAKNGYRLNAERNKYITDYNGMTKEANEVKHNIKSKDDKGMTKVLDVPSKSIQVNDDKCNTNVVTVKESKEITTSSVINKADDICNTLVINEQLKENLINLAEDYSDIKDIIKWFKSRDDKGNINVIEVIQGINIELPESESIRTTIRINNDVWQQFNQFCDNNKHLNKQDLLGMCILEYIQKHK